MNTTRHIITLKVDLKECPFCLSDAIMVVKEGDSDVDFGVTYYDVGCTNKNCYLEGGADYNDKDPLNIVNLWNKRTKIKAHEFTK